MPTQPYGRIICAPFRKRSFLSAVVSACFDNIIKSKDCGLILHLLPEVSGPISLMKAS